MSVTNQMVTHTINLSVTKSSSTAIMVGMIVILGCVFFSLIPVQTAYGIICGSPPCIGFQFPAGYTLNDGAKIIFNNSTSPTDTTDGTIDKAVVKVTSTDSLGHLLDTVFLTLTETGPNTGIYQNTNLFFANGDTKLSVGNTVTVSQGELDGNTNCDGSIINASAIDAICVSVTSTTDPVGIPNFRLTETGKDSQFFTAKLLLTSGTTSANAIKVSPGDIIQITYLGETLYSLIVPNSNPGLAVIHAVDCPDSFTFACDTIDATLSSLSTSVPITVGGGGGGGGGGLIRPGLVLDALLAALGGSPNVVSPPSFGGSYYHYSDGLTITQGTQKTIFDTSKYNQKIPKQVMAAGTPVNMTFKTFESYNPQSVVHMGLYIIPSGQDMITPNNIASIVWEKNSPVQVNDPNHILSNASAFSNSDGTFQYTGFSFIPQKSYDKMSFLVRAWNDHLYSTDIRVHDAVVPPQASKTLPAGVMRYDDFNDLQSALEKDKFYKPQIMAHIHSTTDVFSSTDGGHLYWLYDTINHSITLVIEDKNDNKICSYSEALDPFVTDKKGDYGFMQFTVKQLNREDVQQEKQALEIEAAKAMAMALKNGLLGHDN